MYSGNNGFNKLVNYPVLPYNMCRHLYTVYRLTTTLQMSPTIKLCSDLVTALHIH